MSKQILVLPGDGIGPEVMRETIRVIDWMDRKRRASFDLQDDVVGGAAIDLKGTPITEETVARAIVSPWSRCPQQRFCQPTHRPDRG